jgi:hypothetical protein
MKTLHGLFKIFRRYAHVDFQKKRIKILVSKVGSMAGLSFTIMLILHYNIKQQKRNVILHWFIISAQINYTIM